MLLEQQLQDLLRIKQQQEKLQARKQLDARLAEVQPAAASTP